MKNWIKLTKNNIPKGTVLMTNNIKARDANGDMSHVWIGGILDAEKGYCAASLMTIHELTHFMKIPLK